VTIPQPDTVPSDSTVIGVAITVPEPYGTVLQTARARAGDAAAPFIPPHITLLGPTVIKRHDLAVITDHVSSVIADHGSFTVHLRSTGTFRPVSPVVFVEVAEGIAPCEMLEQTIRTGPLEQDLRFHYHPHVTIAHDVDDSSLDEAFGALAGFEARFPVSTVDLYEQGADSCWRVLRQLPLGAPVAAS